ncbi:MULTISPECIES: IS110 family transposase [Streptomyces]|uniref:IS110 family transposase n=1 Tax=unclassified Streptomyces TaxID=2593676 RepID=UPI001E466DEA|nr:MULTISPECIES: IS110 family transposase [Streptomyces]
MARLVEGHAPQLLDVVDRFGHGHHLADHGGGQPERLDSEASFAALCGVSPVERSSGRRQFRRLDRGGDRQANAALHRIVFTRLRVDPRTQDYYERRIKEGKTRREIVRCLKRYAAREVFHLVKQPQPARAVIRRGPAGDRPDGTATRSRETTKPRRSAPARLVVRSAALVRTMRSAPHAVPCSCDASGGAPDFEIAPACPSRSPRRP